jgi:hypothetical protein
LKLRLRIVVTLVYASERVVPRLGAHESLDPLDGKSHEELERMSAQSLRWDQLKLHLRIVVTLVYASEGVVPRLGAHQLVDALDGKSRRGLHARLCNAVYR